MRLSAIEIITCVLIGAILMGMLVCGGMTIEKRHYQNAAYERGYAEWVAPDNGRGVMRWRWIEPQVE